MSEGIMVDYPYTSNYDLLTLLTKLTENAVSGASRD